MWLLSDELINFTLLSASLKHSFRENSVPRIVLYNGVNLGFSYENDKNMQVHYTQLAELCQQQLQ